MNSTELFEALQRADTAGELAAALFAFESEHGESLRWVPVGGKQNNSGIINVASDPGRSLVERLTNSVDAVLEHEHEIRNGIPDCRTPREAACAWLGIPAEGLSALTSRQRQEQANRVTIRVTAGEGRKESRTVEVRDTGIGISPARMPETILSLNESNKWQKHYLAGTFGQGGSSTFASSSYTVIASRCSDAPRVGFTIVKYQDLPPSEFKTSHYVYLVGDRGILEAEVREQPFPRGTQTKHFGYDLTSYDGPVGGNSLYGLLNKTLFDPILPVWLDSRVHEYRRVIKGSRNALNGAVDEGDDDIRKSKLAHSVRMFYVTLGEFGQLGVEYWALGKPNKESRKPSAAFVNPRKPIVLTLNGQNQDEMTGLLVRKDAELPHLALRLICHIDCNQLTQQAKRLLFTSTREEGRSGIVRGLIQSEVVRVLRSDDELKRLNEEARLHDAQEQDESAVRLMRREVARILQLQGMNVSDTGGLEKGRGAVGGSQKPPKSPSKPRKPVVPISLVDPPTFVRFVWDEEVDLTFYSEQRRYLRIETDADSRYHTPNSPSSPMNFIVSGAGVTIKGSTPLQGGRMRVIVEADARARIGDVGRVRVELTRPGLPTLSSELEYAIIDVPPTKPSDNKLTLPPFEVIAVDGPDDPRWIQLAWPDDVEEIASSAEMEGGKLTVYFSTAFPRFAQVRNRLAGRDPTRAASYVERYKIWLAVHSFLLYRDQQAGETSTMLESQSDSEIASAEKREREERCRIAALSSMFADRETAQAGALSEDSE